MTKEEMIKKENSIRDRRDFLNFFFFKKKAIVVRILTNPKLNTHNALMAWNSIPTPNILM